MTEWQPIETAPKAICVLVANIDKGSVTEAFLGWDGWRKGPHGTGFVYPTHWMPLPDPPSTIDAGAAK